MGLTLYLPTDAKWVASDGKTWGIEQLLQEELNQDLPSSACGGTHRLIGITMALNQHVSQGGELTGVWKDTDAKVQNAIQQARAYQNPDGSFSTEYFFGPGVSPDLAQNLGTTGHVVEFLSLAMTEEQLQQAWVKRAVKYLCDLFHKTKGIDLECGALYHAAHGLVLYRERVFGRRDYQLSAKDS
jgi:hypothetical protein